VNQPIELEIEHVAFSVKDPPKVAAWYVKHLGMRIVRKLDASPFTHFLADSAGHVTLEIYNNSAVAVPHYSTMDPLLLHIAFCTKDVESTRQRLLAAGATPEGDVATLNNGDVLAMLRDPWGLPIQLVCRTRPMP